MTRLYLFAYYTLDSQVSLSSWMSIKTGLFFFLTFFCIITPISGIIDHYCIMENFKKSRENKNKLRTIYSKNYENFKNRKPRVQKRLKILGNEERSGKSQNFIEL